METRSPGLAQGRHGVADAGPGRAGVAADVDDVGPGGAVALGLGEQVGSGQARGVVDLGEDGDVVAAVIPAAAAPGAWK